MFGSPTNTDEDDVYVWMAFVSTELLCNIFGCIAAYSVVSFWPVIKLERLMSFSTDYMKQQSTFLSCIRYCLYIYQDQDSKCS